MSAFRNTFEDGADQFLRLESSLAVKSVDYDLQEQYLGRLGLNGGLLDQLEAMGAVGDLAIVTPDLFFIDGTHVTVIVTLTSPDVTKSVLELIGLDGSGASGYETYMTPAGKSLYWAIRDNVLIMSSDTQEISDVLNVRAGKDGNSLGLSPEFRYMSQQISVVEQTDAFFYFSNYVDYEAYQVYYQYKNQPAFSLLEECLEGSVKKK